MIKKYLLIVSSLLFLGSNVTSEQIIRNSVITFGIRHDKELIDYETILSKSNMDLPDFSPVIAFIYTLDEFEDEEYTATGTLISPYWILTAGHNFYVAEEQKQAAKPRNIQVFLGNDPNQPNRVLEVEKIVFHPTWLYDNMDFVYANDLCLVKLKEPITTITPAQLFTSSLESLGSKIWFCGYGDYSLLEGQDSDLFSSKHALENILDRKVNDIVSTDGSREYKGGLLAFDFDNPQKSINSLGDSLINEDEELLGAGTSDKGALLYEGTTVQGDSGGPLFLKDDSQWKLAGVLSGGASEPIEDHKDSSYGDISIFIRVSSHLEWVESVIK